MIYNIDDKSTYTHIIIDDIYKLFIIENVMNYSLINFDTHRIETCEKTDDIVKSNKVEYYFAIDLLFDDAFGHWVYESAIYLPIYNKLKDKYPNIKILLKEKKTYKLFFLNFFNIMERDIVYNNEINSNNVCIFPSPISPLNNNSNFTDIYKSILYNFCTIFSNYQKCIEPYQYDYVILPRQNKENYKGNDREYNLESVYESISTITNKYYIIHTDMITNIYDQISRVRSASNVILTDGSPFLVNNMFCKNQKLFVFDTITTNQSANYIKLKYIQDMISELNNNTYTYLSKHTSVNELIKIFTF